VPDVSDLCKKIYGEGQADKDFREMLNEYFVDFGVGWQLREEKVISRV
jgi:hypothetical protein